MEIEGGERQNLVETPVWEIKKQNLGVGDNRRTEFGLSEIRDSNEPGVPEE